MADRAFEEGKLAASQGVPATANPYDDEADERGSWEAGHEYASEHDDDDNATDDA